MLAPRLAVAAALCLALPSIAEGKPRRHQLEGVASFYSRGQHTASGERYRPDAMTAAHKTLPFGTRLRVTRGDRFVVVRINDRGPFRRHRFLDCSRACAKALGYTRQGTARVTAEILPAWMFGRVPVPSRRPLDLAAWRTAAAKQFQERREVMHSEEVSPTSGGSLAHPRPVTASGASPAGAFVPAGPAMLMLSLPAGEPNLPPPDWPPLLSLPAPFPILGNIFRAFVDSLVRPVGNCREFDSIDPHARRVVNDLARELGGQALAISCYRSPEHNRRVGGARLSQHLRRKAIDFKIVVRGEVVDKHRLARLARQHPIMRRIGGIGTYCRSDFIHVDVGPRRDWHWDCGERRTRYAHRRQHRG